MATIGRIIEEEEEEELVEYILAVLGQEPVVTAAPN
jgi:hypothetical protein